MFPFCSDAALGNWKKVGASEMSVKLRKLRGSWYIVIDHNGSRKKQKVGGTLDDVLWRVFRDNRVLADALSVLAANAIQSFASAKHGLRTGIIAFLNTFNGELKFNSHVHTMATAGGWRLSSGSWARSVYYDPNILMRLWRGAVLDLLRTALHAGRLKKGDDSFRNGNDADRTGTLVECKSRIACPMLPRKAH
jgi:hypothetical protein